ncbi:prefoldin 6 [Arctopsyche grandis]|uniref:prefoldin 6 n=1 Tax=Arctopsyche grandis TaxID=121162 RepID=UPI00406D6561
MAEEIQKKFQKELDSFKAIEKDLTKAVSQRKLLDSQLNENKAVQQELDLLQAEAEVYKLIGPVLVKQGLEDARQNVSKRMEYISKELKRMDTNITSLQQRQEGSSTALSKLEKEFQQAQVKAALKH